MLIYYGLLLIVFILLYFSRMVRKEYNGKVKQKTLIFIALSILIIVAGIRWNVGTDFPMYNSFFEIYKSKIIFDMKIEPIFKLFCYIPGQLFTTSTMTFILIAVYTYYLVFMFCKKNCKYYDLALFLFISMGFYFSSLNIIRQWMAIPVILLSYDNIAEKKYKKGLIYIIIGYLCHYTSIIILPFLFFIKLIRTEKTRIIIIMISILAFIFSNQIINILNSIIINIPLLSKYVYYFSQKNTMNASLIIPLICLFVYLFYLIMLKLKKGKVVFEAGTEKLSVFLNVLIFAFMFTLLGTKIDIFERISHYFFPIIMIIIPLILEMLEKTENRKIITIAILLLGIAFYTNTMNNNGGKILPYQTIIGERR